MYSYRDGGLGFRPHPSGDDPAAIAAFIIDKNWRAAIGYALFGAACSFFGIVRCHRAGHRRRLGATIG